MEIDIIEIPAGTQFIDAASIPNWIAEKITPLPANITQLKKLEKKFLVGEKHWQVGPLEEQDYLLLRHIWNVAELPFGMSREEFSKLLDAFNSAENKPTWDLQAEFFYPKDSAENQRSNIRYPHFKAIEDAAKEGKIILLDTRRMPTTSIKPGVIISVDDANIYLQPRGFILRKNTAISIQEVEGKSSISQTGSAQSDKHVKVPVLRQQEAKIMTWLMEAGYDPANLPLRINGHGTLKADARAALDRQHPFEGTTTFDGAWERLRANKEIKEVDVSKNPPPYK